MPGSGQGSREPPATRTKDGATALTLAAQTGHAPCVNVLLECGADVHATSNDGQIHFAPSVCEFFQTNNILKINMRSDGPGILQFFWSDGGRFVDKMGQSSITKKFEPGENSLVLPVGTGECKRLRLDPTNVGGQKILLRSLSVAPLSINRWPYYFRIFRSRSNGH